MTPFLVAGATAVLLYFVFFRGLTPVWLFQVGEGGLWLDEAHRVVHGEVMYRDFFEFLMPGVVYLNAIVIAIFGATAKAMAWMTIAIGVAIAVVLHRIAIRFVAAPWSFFAPIVFATLLYPAYSPGNHKWPALLAALCAIAFVLADRVFAAGLLAGVAVLFTQDFGVAVAVGILIALIRMRRRVLVFIGGAAIPVVVTFVAFGFIAGWQTVFFDTIVFPLTHYSAANAFGFTFGALRLLPRSVGQLLFAAAAIASAAWVVVRRPLDAIALVATPGLLLVIAASVRRGMDPSQLAMRCTILAVVVAWALEKTRATRFVAMLIVASALFTGAAGIWYRQIGQTLLRRDYRAGRVYLATAMPDLDWLHVHVGPGEPVFLLPEKGGYFFLSRTRNATSMPYVQSMGFSSREQLQTVMREIEAKKPRVGIYDPTRWYKPETELAEFLRTDYAVERTFENGAQGMRR